MADLIVSRSQAQTETEVASWTVPSDGKWTIAADLTLSMYLKGVVKSAIARVRDPDGNILGSYIFGNGQEGTTTDGGDSTDGNKLGAWSPVFYAVAASADGIFTLTVQSNNDKSPDIYSTVHTIVGGGFYD